MKPLDLPRGCGRLMWCFVPRLRIEFDIFMEKGPKERGLNLAFSLRCLFFFLFSGVDGPSQMALEDIAMFRSIPNCVVFYPSDAVSCERAVELAANYKDMTFIRATRGDTPVVYANDEKFEIGKAKVREKMSL